MIPYRRTNPTNQPYHVDRGPQLVGRYRQPPRGRLVTAAKPIDRHHPTPDTCAHPECDTRLSTYNPGDLCWVHEPRRKPARIYGRKAPAQ